MDRPFVNSVPVRLSRSTVTSTCLGQKKSEMVAKKKDEAEFSQVPLTPLDELNRFVKEKKMPAEVIKSIMSRVTGTDKLSTEMNNEELQKVLDYLKLMK